MRYANSNGIRIDAIKEKEKPENATCRHCNSKVILKFYKDKRDHFAHINKSNCEYYEYSNSSNYKSDFHTRVQELFDSEGAETEVSLPPKIADVLYESIVYEVQHSQIHINEVKSRNQHYKSLTKHLPVWIINYRTQNPKNYPKENIVIVLDLFRELYEVFYKEYQCTFKFETIKDFSLRNLDHKINNRIKNELKSLFIESNKLEPSSTFEFFTISEESKKVPLEHPVEEKKTFIGPMIKVPSQIINHECYKRPYYTDRLLDICDTLDYEKLKELLKEFLENERRTDDSNKVIEDFNNVSNHFPLKLTELKKEFPKIFKD